MISGMESSWLITYGLDTTVCNIGRDAYRHKPLHERYSYNGNRHLTR